MPLKDGDPRAERPALRVREREPRNPEPGPGRHGREIDVPGVIGDLCDDDAAAANGDLGIVMYRRRCLANHGSDRRRAEVEPGTDEDVRDPLAADRGEPTRELPHEVPDEIRTAVDRFDRADERLFSRFVEALHPDHQGLQVHEEDPCRYLLSPAAGGSKLQDMHAPEGGIVRSAVSACATPAWSGLRPMARPRA